MDVHNYVIEDVNAAGGIGVVIAFSTGMSLCILLLLSTQHM